MVVECADGTRLEVVPQRVGSNGELVLADPTAVNEFESWSTNASVLVRRREGSVVLSKGAGDVDIMSSVDVAANGIMSASKTIGRRDDLYTAYVDGERLNMKDRDGNSFEVRGGDQSVDCKLAVSKRDECPSPRCSKPQQPYQHPDAKLLPLPQNAPPPRLFIVYGDGEAEELCLTREAREVLRVAKEDPEACVTEDERMSRPMESCQCHTIYKTVTLDPVRVPPLAAPPAVAGFHGAGAHAGPASLRPPRTFTEFRQFIEHPAITDEERAAFRDALARCEHWEVQHAAKHEAYGKAPERAPAQSTMLLQDPAAAPGGG